MEAGWRAGGTTRVGAGGRAPWPKRGQIWSLAHLDTALVLWFTWGSPSACTCISVFIRETVTTIIRASGVVRTKCVHVFMIRWREVPGAI